MNQSLGQCVGQGKTRFSLSYANSNGGFLNPRVNGHEAGEKEPTELHNLYTKRQLQQIVKLSESHF